MQSFWLRIITNESFLSIAILKNGALNRLSGKFSLLRWHKLYKAHRANMMKHVIIRVTMKTTKVGRLIRQVWINLTIYGISSSANGFNPKVPWTVQSSDRVRKIWSMCWCLRSIISFCWGVWGHGHSDVNPFCFIYNLKSLYMYSPPKSYHNILIHVENWFSIISKNCWIIKKNIRFSMQKINSCITILIINKYNKVFGTLL